MKTGRDESSKSAKIIAQRPERLDLVARTPADLPEIAKRMWDACGSRSIFAFYGNLGAGKTALIRAICQLLGIEGEVSSPTFAIVNEYLGEKPVYHIDLFRLDKSIEATGIGIEEYLNGESLCFIEWPELIEELLPEGTVRVAVEPYEDESRKISITY